MSKHVYMSVGKLMTNGKRVEEKTGKETNKMRYRGEVPDDYPDIDSHIRKEHALGYLVQVHDEVIGGPVKYGRVVHIEYEIQ